MTGMRKYSAWKNQEQDFPTLACPAPIFVPAPPRASPLPAALASPQQTTFSGSTGLTSSGPSAFSVVPPAKALTASTTTIPSFYGSLMCFPKFLQEISTQCVIRNHMNVSTIKPIPNNEKVDLARFRVKDPNEWAVDDVVCWMLDVAKRNNIPFEEMNMHKFASLTGQEMLTMTEQHFIERDAAFGSLVYNEFRKTISVLEDTILDTALKAFADEEVPSTSATSIDMKSLGLHPVISTISSTISTPQPSSQIAPIMQQQLDHLNSLTQALSQAQNTFNQGLLTPQQTVNAVQSLNNSLASSLAAGLTSGLSPINVNYLNANHNGINPTSPLLANTIQQAKVSPLLKYSCRASTDYEDEKCGRSGTPSGSELKIKKNKDGKPRKRSQHTKGNKLWEFIRDALKDPTTCPSIVRWEDPIEGVFRIVESEKLARLWGERKNNTKMTYEKLSRAMRTYYEKQILVPVPKTGLYPKKLVYKFGPGAHGWEGVKR